MKTPGALTAAYLGRRPYAEMRRVQNEYVRKRIGGRCGELLLLCEHPPTLTLGRRANASDLGMSADEWRSRGVDVVETERGGAATFHGPGQLVLYPVVELRAYGLGVRTFTSSGLAALAGALAEWGIAAEVREQPAGVWLPASEGQPQRKIAAVGLKIVRGVSNHGFALNVCCDLEPFSRIVPCGLPGARATSVEQELGFAPDLRTAADAVGRAFERRLLRGGDAPFSGEHRI